MKAMYRKNAMNMFADAYTAPAYQSATMTMSADRRPLILDTALLAVSFLFDVLRGIGSLAVRIISSRKANP